MVVILFRKLRSNTYSNILKQSFKLQSVLNQQLQMLLLLSADPSNAVRASGSLGIKPNFGAPAWRMCQSKFEILALLLGEHGLRNMI